MLIISTNYTVSITHMVSPETGVAFHDVKSTISMKLNMGIPVERILDGMYM